MERYKLVLNTISWVIFWSGWFYYGFKFASWAEDKTREYLNRRENG